MEPIVSSGAAALVDVEDVEVGSGVDTDGTTDTGVSVNVELTIGDTAVTMTADVDVGTGADVSLDEVDTETEAIDSVLVVDEIRGKPPSTLVSMPLDMLFAVLLGMRFELKSDAIPASDEVVPSANTLVAGLSMTEPTVPAPRLSVAQTRYVPPSPPIVTQGVATTGLSPADVDAERDDGGMEEGMERMICEVVNEAKLSDAALEDELPGTVPRAMHKRVGTPSTSTF